MNDEELDRIYEAVLLREDFDGLLDNLTTHFTAHAGAVLIYDGISSQGLAARQINPESTANYHTDLRVEDWNLYLANSLPIGQVYAASSQIDLDAATRSEYHYQVNRPSEIHDSLIMRLPRDNGWVGIALYRPPGEQFSRSDVNQAEKIYPHIARAYRLLQSKNRSGDGLVGVSRTYHLTDKEAEIVQLIKNAMDYSDICSVLSISRNTLKWHLKNVYEKFGVKGKAGLITKLVT